MNKRTYGVKADWRRIFFMFLGIALFTVVYYAPPLPDAVDPSGKNFILTQEGKGALAIFLLAGTWWLFEVVPIGVTSLAIGVIIGGILQVGLQVPFLIKKGFYFWQKAKFYHPGLKKISRLMFPAIFGAAVYQINILVGTLLASLLPEGSVSYLYYADRLVQFPLGIFAIATATAVLPSISRQATKKNLQAVRDTFSYAMKLVFFITIPSMVGLIVLREPIVALLFKRGAFDAKTTHLTAYALLY